MELNLYCPGSAADLCPPHDDAAGGQSFPRYRPCVADELSGTSHTARAIETGLEQLDPRGVILLPSEVLKRIALIARVFEAINVLLPPERADAWMRAANRAPDFGGSSALDKMMKDGRHGIFVTRQYLLGEIYR